MTADIELLPLTEYLYGREASDNERVVTIADAHAYAFRNVAHHTAAKDAEIAQLEKANEQLHAHGERMHEQLQKMRAAQQPPAEAQPVAWIMQDKDSGDYWPESFALGSEPTEDEPDDAEWAPLFLAPPPSAPVGVAEAWQQGYHQGVQDERTSEENIGIAGFGAKVEPARNNPYRTKQPEVPTWIGIDWAEGQQPAAVDGGVAQRAAKALLDARSYIGPERPDDPDDVDSAEWWDELTELADALAVQQGGDCHGE